MQGWGQEVGVGCRGESRPPKTPEALPTISRKVWKNRLLMITNLCRKQETYLQSRENLLINRYLHAAQCACSACATQHPELLDHARARTSLLLSASLCLFPFSFSLFTLPLHPKATAMCLYSRSGPNLTQFPCQVSICELLWILWLLSFLWPQASANLGCSLSLKGRTYRQQWTK